MDHFNGFVLTTMASDSAHVLVNLQKLWISSGETNVLIALERRLGWADGAKLALEQHFRAGNDVWMALERPFDGLMGPSWPWNGATLAILGVKLAFLGADLAVLSANLAVLGANLAVLGANLAVLGANLAVLGVNLAAESAICGQLQKH